MPRVAKTPVFERFGASDICWDFSNPPENLAEIFDRDAPLMIELGAGTCYFSTGFAKNNPDWNVLATDLKRDRLWKGAKRAKSEKLNNIRFLNINVANLADVIGERSVDQLWLTFPDPYHKARQAKHRTNQKNFLKTYEKLLKQKGSFHLKTDDMNFFIEMIQNLTEHKWAIIELTDDLYRDEVNGREAKYIKTRYEEEFLEAGLPINYLKAVK